MAHAEHSATTGLLDHALAYLERGLPVFPVCGVLAHTHLDSDGKHMPCTSPGKVPLVKWRAYQDRLPTEAEVREWWRRRPDANIGMATGHLSSLVVLDLDGDLAIRAAQALGYDNGPHAFTGRVGGQHRYFAYRPDAPRNFAKHNGIDYRGEGGYVILPPSQHVSGRAYLWGEALGDELPELPEWVDEMAARATDNGHRAGVVEGDITVDRNVTLTSLAGSMRRRGMSEAAILAALRTENDTRCKPPLDDLEVRKIAQSVAGYPPAEQSVEKLGAVAEYAPAELASAAFHGPMGRAALLLADASEACAGAILLHLLSLVSVLLGNKAGIEAGSVFHPPRIWAIVIGRTGVGRKGTAEHGAYRLLRLVDETFLDLHKASGLSSGEGLIEAVRDEQRGQQRNAQTKVLEESVLDPGVEDKRLWVMETELAKTLAMLERKGSSLSAVLRQAWDGEVLRTLTRRANALRATGSHIGIVAHITPDEFRSTVRATDMANGFVNRFLLAHAQRHQLLPFDKPVATAALAECAASIRGAAEVTAQLKENVVLTWSDAARVWWADQYGELTTPRSGLAGEASARAEAQMLRLAATYAVVDTAAIEVAHLEAAAAVWRHSCEVAIALLGGATGNPDADAALEYLRTCGPLTLDELSSESGKHLWGARLRQALNLLARLGLASGERLPSSTGRRPERWSATP